MFLTALCGQISNYTEELSDFWHNFYFIWNFRLDKKSEIIPWKWKILRGLNIVVIVHWAENYVNDSQRLHFRSRDSNWHPKFYLKMPYFCQKTTPFLTQSVRYFIMKLWTERERHWANVFQYATTSLRRGHEPLSPILRKNTPWKTKKCSGLS